jgi:hypothetical protein
MRGLIILLVIVIEGLEQAFLANVIFLSIAKAKPVKKQY